METIYFCSNSNVWTPEAFAEKHFPTNDLGFFIRIFEDNELISENCVSVSYKEDSTTEIEVYDVERGLTKKEKEALVSVGVHVDGYFENPRN